jgi:hypothetical protein
LLIAVAGLALAGCQQDAIETHRVLRPEPPPPPEEKVRLLGAMIPHDQNTWFFKLVGPLDAVEKQKAAFDGFIGSLKFKGSEDVAWELPEGWEKGPDRPGRYATIRVGPKDAALELTVHRLGDEPQTRSELANVNRWRNNDLGLKPLQAGDFDGVTRRQDVDGAKALLVDMKGPGSHGGGRMPPFAGDGGGRPAADKLSYTAPEGWKETDRVITRNGMEFRYEAALKVEEGGASALLTVSKLSGAGGGLLMNVNRWRADQLGLPPLDEAQLADAAKSVKVGGSDGVSVDFTGPGKPPGKEGQRILAVVVPRQGMTWFVKMQGPADLVGKQKAAFDKFVGSLKFDGGNGG